MKNGGHVIGNILGTEIEKLLPAFAVAREDAVDVDLAMALDSLPLEVRKRIDNLVEAIAQAER